VLLQLPPNLPANPPRLAACLASSRGSVVRGPTGRNRAGATRYDKREVIYQGTMDAASIRIWLRDPVPDP